MNIVVKKPLLTEKTLALAAKGLYTFVVDKDSNKRDIKADVEAFYKVTVTDVRTVSVHGKTRRTGRTMKTMQKSDWKKAMVTLATGQKIDAFEVTQKE